MLDMLHVFADSAVISRLIHDLRCHTFSSSCRRCSILALALSFVDWADFVSASALFPSPSRRVDVAEARAVSSCTFTLCCNVLSWANRCDMSWQVLFGRKEISVYQLMTSSTNLQISSRSDFICPPLPLLDLLPHQHFQILPGLNRSPFIAEMVYIDSSKFHMFNCCICLCFNHFSLCAGLKSGLLGCERGRSGCEDAKETKVGM
jgi:hypothetical protein